MNKIIGEIGFSSILVGYGWKCIGSEWEGSHHRTQNLTKKGKKVLVQNAWLKAKLFLGFISATSLFSQFAKTIFFVSFR